MAAKRPVFYISDRTGITAETLGHALLTQFDESSFSESTLPFVNTGEKANAAVEFINHAATKTGVRPIIFSTTISDDIRAIIAGSNALFMDLFDTFIPGLEHELRTSAADVVGRAHGVDAEGYRTRIEAMNYALYHDDGKTHKDYDKADVILVAPSRCGKTPTCIYLAMQFGLYAANYPLTEEDLEKPQLPQGLMPYVDKMFGLTSDPDQLHRIRNERRPGSRYASLQQVSFELRQAESLFTRFNIPFIASHDKSIEELASVIIHEKGIERHSF